MVIQTVAATPRDASHFTRRASGFSGCRARTRYGARGGAEAFFGDRAPLSRLLPHPARQGPRL